MLIHYIWIGSEIPYRYKANIDICYKLNPGYQIMVWHDQDIHRVLTESGNLDLYNNLPNLINKYNLAKYTILDKFGGVYTDLDIKWNKSFTEIQMLSNYPTVDIVLTHSAFPSFMIKGVTMKVLDDPFIITKPGIFGSCLEFRKERIGRERLDRATNVVHEIEPVGPFLLTEWVYYKNISCMVINQEGYLDAKGFYGEHEQMGKWKI